MGRFPQDCLFSCDGVVIRPIERLDLHLMRANRNLGVIWHWCRQNTWINEDAHQDWFERIQSDPKILMFAIAIQDELVGVCGLTDIDRFNQRAEFSLYIFPQFQGKGFGKSALKLLFNHGFVDQNLKVIWGESFEGNPATNLFYVIGMKHEGTRRNFYYKWGRHIDAHLISMTREEFDACATNW